MKLKSAFLVSLFLFVSISVAQANNLPINVIANENTTITFFFPAQIQTVIQPAVNYKFEYEPNSTMGTLVARKGAKSNLTVITKGGIIYSFLLQYDQEVDNFTYVLSPEQAIGKIDAQAAAPKGNVAENTKNIQTADMVVVDQDAGEELMAAKTIKQDFSSETVINEPMVSAKNSTDTNFSAITDDNSEKNEAGMLEDTLKENSLYDTDREAYYDIFCQNNYDQETRLRKNFKAGQGVELQLNSIEADKNELYFVLQMTNRLTTKFNPEALQFFVRTSLEDEPLHMSPVHIFNQQEAIEAGRTRKMVYVLKTFILSEDQKVYVVLNEKDGSRNTILKIDSRTINAVKEKHTNSAR